MISFLIAIAILLLGYFTYGKIVEKNFSPDDRETPAVKINDLNVELGYMPRDIADMMIANSESAYSNFSEIERTNIAHLDAGLISMQVVLLAKDKGILRCSEEGGRSTNYELCENPANF